MAEGKGFLGLGERNREHLSLRVFRESERLLNKRKTKKEGFYTRGKQRRYGVLKQSKIRVFSHGQSDPTWTQVPCRARVCPVAMTSLMPSALSSTRGLAFWLACQLDDVNNDVATALTLVDCVWDRVWQRFGRSQNAFDLRWPMVDFYWLFVFLSVFQPRCFLIFFIFLYLNC